MKAIATALFLGVGLQAVASGVFVGNGKEAIVDIESDSVQSDTVVVSSPGKLVKKGAERINIRTEIRIFEIGEMLRTHITRRSQCGLFHGDHAGHHVIALF